MNYNLYLCDSNRKKKTTIYRKNINFIKFSISNAYNKEKNYVFKN